MAPRQRCSTCGSWQWRKSAVGLVTCSEGHVLQYYINESEEAGGVGAHMMKKRTLKSGRKKERSSRANPRLYHGDRARFHYYQCLQLLFREQVSALMTLWSLPPEFEVICRDFWALHLNIIPSPPPAEPFYYIRDLEGCQREPEEAGKMDSRLQDEGVDPQSAFPVPKAPPSGDELLAPEIATLLEENSEVGSSDNASSSDELCARNDMCPPPKSPFVSRADRPENTIAILVLACWSIRLPVVYMDFINAIESHSLPYLDHVCSFPSSLARHLTKHAVQALSPHYAPKTLFLHRLTTHIANRFYETFDIVVPVLNTAPVLWRIVQECFCGTPMLFDLTKKVREVLSLGPSLQGPSVTPLLSTTQWDARKRDNAPPEVSLIATAIIVLKLVYGLDGKERLPRNSDDAACAFPAVGEFLAAVKEADHAESRVNRNRFGSRVTLSMGDLDDAALDEYFDFCQRVLADPKRDECDIIGNYFPLASGTADGMRDEQRVRGRRMSSARGNGAHSDALEPGEMYTIYDATDALGTLTGDLKMIMERSARWAGVDGDVVGVLVERYERRLVRWWGEIKGAEQCI